jgi:hypothetical protein
MLSPHARGRILQRFVMVALSCAFAYVVAISASAFVRSAFEKGAATISAGR